MSKIIEIKDISFGYGNNLIFDDVSFSVEEGEFVAIVGENGSGKTTMMKLIVGELEVQKGSIEFNFSDRIGYVPQLSAAISNNFPITVKEILSLNLNNRLNGFRLDKASEEKITAILNIVGLKGKKDFLYGELSGGQKQKTMLGKALITNPKLLLLDEPLIGLDKESKTSFLRLLAHQCKDHGITILMITHELKEISEFVDKTIEIGERKVRVL